MSLDHIFNSNGEMDDFFNFLDDQIRKLRKLQNDLMPLDAVWLEKPINGTVRYTDGDLICLDDNDRMINGEYATHKIIGCYGTVDSSRIELMVINVIDEEIKIIILK